MRSFLSAAASVWFLVAAVVMPYGERSGLVGAFAFTVLIGLALLSAAIFEWEKVAVFLEHFGERKPKKATGPATR